MIRWHHDYSLFYGSNNIFEDCNDEDPGLVEKESGYKM